MPFSRDLSEYNRVLANLIKLGYRDNPTPFEEAIVVFERLASAPMISAADQAAAADAAAQLVNTKRIHFEAAASMS